MSILKVITLLIIIIYLVEKQQILNNHMFKANLPEKKKAKKSPKFH